MIARQHISDIDLSISNGMALPVHIVFLEADFDSVLQQLPAWM
jgi:hypothetical protein